MKCCRFRYGEKMEEEIWKDIKGYEGLYQVSNLGKVKYLPKYHTKKEGIMKYTLRSGYRNLILRKNGTRKSKQIHRLVAETFIDNPYNKPFVNHKDYNRQNNNVDNLEWVTQKENVRWSICNMKKRKNKIYSKTGEKYIYYKGNKFRVYIDKKDYKLCNTLDEAIKLRDKILNEIDNKQ